MTFGLIALVALLPVAVAAVSLLIIFGDAKRNSFLLKQGHLPAFKFEQSFLQRKASAKPRQAAVIPNHAMARNDNWNRIRPICGAHSSHSLWAANPFGQHLVGNRFAVRNILQRCPNSFLKRSSFQHKRQIKRFSLTSEIGFQLVDNVREHGSVLVPVGAIYDRGSGPGVWIVNDKSEVKFRSVKIASIGKEEVVVSRGVQAGEKVVALGAHLLHEGQVVNLPNEEKTSYAKF